MFRYIITCSFFFILAPIKAQTTGTELGVSLNVGTSIHRIGAFVQAFTYTKHIQFNSRVSATFNHKHWGNASRTPELQIGIGATYAFGQEYMLIQKTDLVCNKTNYSKSMAYAINWYFDKNNTSQRTGIIAYQNNEWRYIFENDIFGQKMADKYRTAAALISYQYEDVDYALKLILWTGDFKGIGTKRVKNDSTFKSRFGYYDGSKSPHGKESHGILCLQAQTNYSYINNTKLGIGVDAEQVRNVFQNKFMHDAYYVPEKWLSYKNLHFPMITTEEELYLYKEGQQIRKPKFYFNFGVNDNIFY